MKHGMMQNAAAQSAMPQYEEQGHSTRHNVQCRGTENNAKACKSNAMTQSPTTRLMQKGNGSGNIKPLHRLIVPPSQKRQC